MEEKTYEIYTLHLINGDKIPYYEDYELPWKDGLIHKFKNKELEFVEVSDLFHAAYIPVSSIVYITDEGVGGE